MKEKQLAVEVGQSGQCDSGTILGTPYEQHGVWDEIKTSHAQMDAYQEASIKAEVDSPSLAASYAQTIVSSWRSLPASAAMQDGQPCYLLELEAGNGHFACRVLTELQTLLTAQEWRLFSPRYLLADSRAERISDCWQHSALRRWIERGNLEPVEFDARRQRFIDLKSRRLILGANSIANPLIVIANGVFSGMRQSLYHIHYGKCFSAQLSDAETGEESTQQNHTEEGAETGRTYDYHWNEEHSPQNINALLPRYVERLDSGLVLIPQQAFEVIGRLTELAGNGTLLLSSDRGFYGERNLREQWIPEMGPHARYFLPVNGHALSWHVEAHGGNVTHFQSANDCALHSVIWCPAPKSSAVLDTRPLTNHFSHDRDATVRRMTQLSHQAHETITAEQLLSLLRLADYDHSVLFAHLACLFESLQHLDSRQRISWRDTLKQVWRQYYSFTQDAELLTELGLLAMRLGAWGTAKRSLSCVVNELPEQTESRYYLAACHLHLGERDAAQRLLAKCLELAPGHEAAEALRAQLNNWTARSQSDACYEPTLCRDKELSLQPLAMHYTEEFLYQYRDPSIAVMTSLPDFANVEEFEEWRLAQNEIANKGLYAIVHREHGFLGVVSLRWHQDTAFFYFWIGADYQGQGYGQRAAQLLFKMAAHTVGIQSIYTCAFEDNSRSVSALNDLGFKQLPFEAKAPDDAYVFFTTGQEPLDAQYGLLSKLLKGIESPIRLLDIENRR